MKNILLVEDDDLSQKTMSILLKKKYQVDICKSADDFYANFSSNDYDIIIMDIGLGKGKDGLQLTREIKKMPLFSNTPVLCITAHAYSKDKANAYAAGVDFYLSKPVYNDVVLETIDKLLNHEK
ncbi:MAG: response regulator [Bacteroidetes bacterium]|nr:response regulator [Bacteroidota bacterium]MBU2505486.1 response regulator [Bacteroidota bacterium]